MKLPFIGFIVDADDDHRRRVDQWFQTPMLILSLLVLPILIVCYYVSQHPRVTYMLDMVLLVISAAFLVEFLIKVTVARSRARYCLANWLDIVIIMLPFLRPFRVARAARVLQMSRAYAFRGVYAKFVRTAPTFILGTRVVQRWRARHEQAEQTDQTDQTRPDYQLWSRAALIAEIDRLRAQLEKCHPPEGRAIGPSGDSSPVTPAQGTGTPPG